MVEKTVQFFFEPKAISKVKIRQSKVIWTYTKVSLVQFRHTWLIKYLALGSGEVELVGHH